MSKYRTFLRHRILIPVNRRKQITHFDAFDLCLADQKMRKQAGICMAKQLHVQVHTDEGKNAIVKSGRGDIVDVLQSKMCKKDASGVGGLRPAHNERGDSG
jgi:hypothetical protein